jgi:hypothetical protein
MLMNSVIRKTKRVSKINEICQKERKIRGKRDFFLLRELNKILGNTFKASSSMVLVGMLSS